MLPLELVERLNCLNYFGDFVAHGIHNPAENTAPEICAPPPIECARAFG